MMPQKEIIVTLYRQNHKRENWRVDMEGAGFELFFIELSDDLSKFGVSLSTRQNDAITIDVDSYADLLNAVRLASPADGFSSLCVGHIIGKSPNLDLMEDIKRAVNRVAFAPETIPPEDHNRKVCHNCGCGC